MKPSLTRKQLQYCRREAVRLFGEGLTNAAIGRRLGVSRQSVSGWHQRFEAQGTAGLQMQPPGPAPRLSQQQLQELAHALLLGAQAHGYDTQLWTLERIADLIHQQTGIKYHPSHVWKILRRMGWSSQKPVGRAKERNEAAIAQWVQEEMPRIKRGPSSEGPF
jgi:transposase